MEKCTFICITRFTSYRKSGGVIVGGANYTMNIFLISNNNPTFVTMHKYCTSNYKGVKSECLSALKRSGTLPQTIEFNDQRLNDIYLSGYWVWSMKDVIDIHHLTA